MRHDRQRRDDELDDSPQRTFSRPYYLRPAKCHSFRPTHETQRHFDAEARRKGRKYP